MIGTSIGFKNIASKIANELKLWLPVSGPDVSTDDQQQQYTQQWTHKILTSK